MDVLSRLICVVLFQLSLCDNREELSRSRRAALPLNNPQYQIIPRAQRRNYWEYSYEDFGGSYEEEERAWLDGDFGMRSSNYKQKVFSPHKSNRRQRNMKVKRFLVKSEDSNPNHFSTNTPRTTPPVADGPSQTKITKYSAQERCPGLGFEIHSKAVSCVL